MNILSAKCEACGGDVEFEPVRGGLRFPSPHACRAPVLVEAGPSLVDRMREQGWFEKHMVTPNQARTAVEGLDE